MCKVYLISVVSCMLWSAQANQEYVDHKHTPPYAPPQDRHYVQEEYQPEVLTGMPFHNNIGDYIPEEEYQAAGIPDYWYEAEDKVIRPSATYHTGYVPREIMHFRETFKYLRTRYPQLPLLSPEDFAPEHPKDTRQGRFAILGGIMNALFGGGFVKGVKLDGGVATGEGVAAGGAGGLGGVKLGLANTFANFLGAVGGDADVGKVDAGAAVKETVKSPVYGVKDFIYSSNYSSELYKNMIDFCETEVNEIGTEVCRNGDGVCEYCDTCIRNGGVTLGQCGTPSFPKLDSKSPQLCCCQYSFDTDSTSSAAISYFTSPGFPDSVRSSFSTALSLEVREDVDQILVEFVSFELPAGPQGCNDGDYLEVIAPTAAGGILGPGNSRFCGLNTDQHFYLNVNPGDIVIFKAVLSGTGFVPFNEEPSKKNKKNWHYRTGASRFELKITQILKPLSQEGMKLKFFEYVNNKLGAEVAAEFKNWDLDSYMAMNYSPYQMRGYCGIIPEYYWKLRAPSNCLQFYSEIRGTFQNFNFDGKTCMPPNLDYTVCFDHPSKYCGLTLSALQFDIPTRDPVCMSGENYSSGPFPCCTAGFVGRYGAVNPKQVQKYLGVDGTSDGGIQGTKYSYNQPRYFFCGESLGRTDFVTSERRGPGRVQVYSDWHPCTECGDYKSDGVGFKIKYNIEMGSC